MRLVKPSFEIEQVTPNPLQLIERAGRTCYKSEDRTTEESAPKFAKMIVSRNHHSVLEHASATVNFIIDRGVSHELVRHRLCAFSQESTRYCNYGKAGQVSFVIPPWCDIEPGDYADGSELATSDEATVEWFQAMRACEREYLQLLELGWKPEQARSVLPNSLKTEIVMTANLREWGHVLKLRTDKRAHRQMREVMIPLLAEFRQRIPVIFDAAQVSEVMPEAAS